MTAVVVPEEEWRALAACSSADEASFFKSAPDVAKQTCQRCPVRGECLYDAVQADPPIGVWGGLTRKERSLLPELPPGRAAAVVELRALADTATTPSSAHPTNHTLRSSAPKQKRSSRPTSSAERTTPPMTATPAASSPSEIAEALPVDQLLEWGDAHSDPEVQDQAARARVALVGLRRRHAADAELTAITSEAEELEQRLAELRTRQAALAPAKKATKKAAVQRDYEPATVRAWAKDNGVDCPATGRVPKAVVEAWRTAAQNTGAGTS